jgi:two-component system, NarL family, sensor kinase
MRRTLFVPVPSDAGNAKWIIGVTQDVTVMTTAEEEMRRLSHRLITVQNDEQRRLSRILHETASQTLAAIALTLGAAARQVKLAPSEAPASIADARSLVEDVLREIRSVSALLHPPMLEEAGLATALDTYIRSFADRSGLRIRFQIPADHKRMSRELEITLFRVIQESLTNVHRHAKARNCVVRIKQSADTVSLEVTDDGIGIRVPHANEASKVGQGVGISGMRERVQQHQGVFAVRRSRSGGTTVAVELPIQLRVVEINRQETTTCHQPKPKSRTSPRSSDTASKLPTITVSFAGGSAPSSKSSPTSRSFPKPLPEQKRSNM